MSDVQLLLLVIFGIPFAIFVIVAIKQIEKAFLKSLDKQ
jgi:hypothetical protein